MGARAAIYARVSTLWGQSPQMQLDVLREYAARRGLAVVAEFVDVHRYADLTIGRQRVPPRRAGCLTPQST